MPSTPKLKVYRMPIGFHDAYVAAPSQKAAAEAWGTDTGVFARKEAELVTDPALAEEPLARPGEVVKRLRGTEAEQIAALGATVEPPPPRRRSAPAAKPKPRPSRAALDEAERLLAEAKLRHSAELSALAEREASLAKERREVEQRLRQERQRLEERRDEREAEFAEALRRWQG